MRITTRTGIEISDEMMKYWEREARSQLLSRNEDPDDNDFIRNYVWQRSKQYEIDKVRERSR